MSANALSALALSWLGSTLMATTAVNKPMIISTTRISIKLKPDNFFETIFFIVLI